MSNTNTAPRGQEFEHALDKSDKRVAAFEVEHRSPLEKVQHALHGNSTLVPVIVLLAAIVAFGLIAGGRFFGIAPSFFP